MARTRTHGPQTVERAVLAVMQAAERPLDADAVNAIVGRSRASVYKWLEAHAMGGGILVRIPRTRPRRYFVRGRRWRH